MQSGKQSGNGARLFEPVSLDDYMTEDEQRRLAEALCKVIEHGYGSILLEIHEGSVKFITASERYIIPRV